MHSLSGKWKNQVGSVLDLIITNLAVTGYYITKVGDDESRDKKCMLTGYATDELISFSVLWEKRNSITSWVGRYQNINGIESLHTIWLLVSLFKENEIQKKDVWESFLVNSSVFTRM